MAKGFRDLMAKAGFSTERADAPRTASGYEDDGLGTGTSSDSPGSDRGAPGRVLAPNSGLRVRGEQGGGAGEYNRLGVERSNDVRTPATETPSPSDFTG